MIVVDTSVLVHALEPGPLRREMDRVLLRDSRWAAPRLWRSELRNYLAKRMRRSVLRLDQALALADRAETLLGEEDYEVPTASVLELSQRSGCSAYDAEFAALALVLDVPLLTTDGALLAAFPDVAVAPGAFAAGR